MAMTKVMEEMVFTMEVTNVGDVYFRLAKYMFRVKLTLRDEGDDALNVHVGIFVQVFFFLSVSVICSEKVKKKETVSVI
jgi:hypothetical protein